MGLASGLESSDSVEERRCAVGLPPLQPIRTPRAGEPSPVTNPRLQLTEMQLWARRVGWRN